MPGPNSQAMYEANLQEGMIFADHPAAGVWESLQGTHCATWEIETMESRSEGTSRHQAPTKSPEWDSTIIVHTLTTGPDGSGAQYRSHIPNH